MDQDSRILLERASQGDPSAVDALLQRHLPGLQDFVRRNLGQLVQRKESSSDLVQSACREVLEHAGRFQYDGEEGFRRYERMSRDEPPTHVTRTVLDANGNAVSGATVFVRERQNLLDSRLRSFRDAVHPVPLVTDGSGKFSVPHVAGVIYDVTVVAEGFAMASTRLYGSASESLILSSPSRLAGVGAGSSAGSTPWSGQL